MVAQRTTGAQRTAERKHMVAQIIHNRMGNYAGSFGATIGSGPDSIPAHDANILVAYKAANIQAGDDGRCTLSLTKTGCKIHDRHATLHDRHFSNVISQFERHTKVKTTVRYVRW